VPKDNVAVFSAWLYKMAHNKMVDVLRAQKRAHQVALRHAHHVASNVSMGATEDRIELEEILQKLQYLNETQRAVILLRFIENMSIAETATILQKSEAAIKALQQRALEALRGYLKP
jgi:RNA polymerase sigma-70 factor (ECF subfamily)